MSAYKAYLDKLYAEGPGDEENEEEEEEEADYDDF